jgi:ankyrin repeat protein
MMSLVVAHRRSVGKISVFAILLTVIAACSESSLSELNSAVLNGDFTKLESLLNDPAIDINTHNEKVGSALYTAATYVQPNQEAMVRLLLRRGADPNVASNEQMTALISASYHGNAPVVKLLIDAGADVNAAEARYGFTPLAEAARNGNLDVIRLLLDAGADRGVAVKNGRLPLALARQYGNDDAARLLASYQPASGAR